MSEPERVCEYCGKPIPARKYQSEAVRACGPGCAREIAYREHPDLGGFATRRVVDPPS